MKHNIKVTTGLCVRNAEATIKQAIDSILNQDFPHELMELIVVDGCSEDKTLDIIKSKFKNSYVKSRIFCEKKGLGYARQIVVDNAQGQYIIWVDGDMLLSRDFVRKQVSSMEQNPRVGIAKGKYGMHKGNNLVATLEDIEFALSFGCEGKTNLMSLGTSGCIYRVKAIRQVGGFDSSIKGAGEDTDVERRNTWKSLWDEYFWHGIGASYVFRKNRRSINIYKMLPPVALLAELFRVPLAYKLTRRKAAFLLPFHYVFKRIAWFLGFIKGEL